VLIDYGLGEKLAETLVESGVSTVEKLGSMTPEDLEAIEGIGPTMVEKIQLAVNAYYGQFEPGGEPEVWSGAGDAPAKPQTDAEAGAEASEAQPVSEGSVEAPQGVETEALETAGESVETPDSVPAESDTMKENHASVQSPDEKGEVHES
jgi:N utilization substance protein A